MLVQLHLDPSRTTREGPKRPVTYSDKRPGPYMQDNTVNVLKDLKLMKCKVKCKISYNCVISLKWTTKMESITIR